MDWLNSEGITTTKGNLWQNSVLRKLLSNPRYVGLYTVEGRVTGDGCWDGIVDPEVFERVGEDLRSRTRGPAASRWWLVGLATCGQCGGPMVVNNDRRGTPRYLCNRRGRPVADGSDPCGRVSAGVAYIDPLVLGALSAAIQDTRPPTADGDAETTVLRGELADLQRKIARLSEDRFVREVIDDDDYFPARALLKEREAGVLSRLHAIRVVPAVEVEKGETLMETAGRIEGLDLTARRRLVRAVFRTLQIHVSEQRGPRFDPQRVTFERADAPVTASS